MMKMDRPILRALRRVPRERPAGLIDLIGAVDAAQTIATATEELEGLCVA
jgi:hypothetical protein